MSKETYIETTLSDWNDLTKLNRFFFSPFIFRGQSNSEWSLQNSIERNSLDFRRFKRVDGYNTEEKWMLHEFKRKYHLYSNLQIENNDNFEWLSVMQHHGAPTRLLDFTESLYIAAYFAVIESSSESSIWGINRIKLRDNLLLDYKLPYKKRIALKDTINLHHIDFANDIIACEYSKIASIPKTVIPLDTKFCSERLAKQQGLFLMPTSPIHTFQENLDSAFNNKDGAFNKIVFDEFKEKANHEKMKTDIEIFKINIPANLKNDISMMLKEMNLTAEVLFPGLDGLAKSLLQTKIIGL